MVVNNTYTLVVSFLENNEIEDKGVTFIGESKEDKFVSYKDLYHSALKHLSFLYSQNVKCGDKLIFQIENNHDFVVSFWACLLGGIIPVPLNNATNIETFRKMINVWNAVDQPKIIATSTTLKKILQFVDKCNLVSYLENLKNAIILCDLESSEKQKENIDLIHFPNPSETAFIQFSSGSTGTPKGVVLTHENILVNVYAMAKSSKWNSQDLVLSWMPLTHDMGIIGLHITPVVLQCQHYLMDTFLFAYFPLTWIYNLSKYEITISSCPNFGYEHVLRYWNYKKNENNIDLSHLRFILNGAEPISLATCNRFITEFSSYGFKNYMIMPVYGLAEGSLAITNTPLGEQICSYLVKRTSLQLGKRVIIDAIKEDDLEYTAIVDLGIPVGEIDISIRNETLEILPNEYVGIVCIKGKNVTKGYYNNSEINAVSFTSDGYFITGDLGFIKNGRLSIVGRKKEILFVNGENYYSNDLERLIIENLKFTISKVAVIGLDTYQTKKNCIGIFVQYKGEITDFILIKKAIQKLLLFKIGITVSFVIPIDYMPTTTSGKVQRFEILNKYNQGVYDDTIKRIELLDESLCNIRKSLNTQKDIQNNIIKIWRKVVGSAIPLDINDNFFESGGNSLLISQIGNELQKEYDGITIMDLFNYPTVYKLSSYIKELINSRNTES